MVKKNSEEKANLIKIVRRLEDEKKMLESVNSTAKGDISSQLQQNKELITRNESLSKELSDTSSDLASAKKENEALNNEKSVLEEKLRSIENTLSQVKTAKENAEG